MPDKKIKRLKDKIFPEATIKIDRLIEQYQDDFTTINKTIAFLVTINRYPTKVMFRADSRKDLWEMIKYEVWLEPLKKVRSKNGQ